MPNCPPTLSCFSQRLRDYFVTKRCKSALWVRLWILIRKIYGASDTLLKELSEEDPKAYRLHLRMSQSLFEELLDKISPLIQAQNALRTSSQPSSRRLKPHVEGLHVRSCLCCGSAAQSHCGVVAKSRGPSYFDRCGYSRSLGRTALSHN